MRVDWLDELGRFHEGGELHSLLARVAEAVVANEGLLMEVSFGISFVAAEKIREINRVFRRVDSVTDVLSFPTIGVKVSDADKKALLGAFDPEDGSLCLGDLVLCPERIEEQAKEYGHGNEREYGYMVAHGLLHLLGYDHETHQDRDDMRELEEAALEKANLTRT